MNKALTGGVVVALVLSGLAFFSAPSNTVTERVIERVGASVGPEHYELQYFTEGFIVGSPNTDVASSTDDAATVASNALLDCDIPYVQYTPNLSTTITTQASTSQPFSSLKVGEVCQQLWFNASSTSGTITFAAGTGVDLQDNEDSADLAIPAGGSARFTWTKKSDNDILLIMEEWLKAD